VRYSLLYRTPRKSLQAAMDSEEFAELQAYERYFEPTGDAREDLRAALVAYHAASAFGGSRGQTLRDYQFKFKPPTFTEDPAEQEHAIRDKMSAWRESHNAALARQKHGNNRKPSC
jgi:hypothetical protein